jgi:hypothetical protein
MGLGPLANLPLAEARKKARTLATQRDDGNDPIEARRQVRADNLAKARAKAPVNFRKATEAYFADFAPTWKHKYAPKSGSTRSRNSPIR